QKAWAQHADRFMVGVPAGELSASVHPEAHVAWAHEFGRSAPVFVEIGSGRGEALVALAQRHPEANIVAFEVFAPAVASTLSRINRHGLANVRIVLADGVDGLRHLFGPSSIAQLWTFFPDPWHKARHHKRRLVTPEFAALAASRLEPGGLWRLATDWEGYAVAMREVLDAAPDLESVHDGWAPRFEERPLTKYEARGLAAGRGVHDLTYRRSGPATVGDLVHRTRLPGATGEVAL
ncbi:MAG: tRNA (guanosine(46)-N7)-methyltransferase TrmB, partial [Actinomycetes bacterium]